MKKISIKRVALMTILLISLFGGLACQTFAGSQITASKNNVDAGINTDNWNLNGNYSKYINPETDIDGNITTINGTILRTVTGAINSTLYGNFNIINLNAVYNSAKFNTYTSDCPSGGALTLNGAISSDIWGNFDIDSNSHVCLIGGKIVIKLKSLKIGEKDLGAEGTATTTNISQEIKANGINKVNTNAVNSPIRVIEGQFQDQKYIVKTNINKQLETILRGSPPETTITKLSKSAFEDAGWSLKYFNYEGQKELMASNEDNIGKILKLENSYSFSSDPSNYKLKVVGQKTIIVKGGNIYINADIYNDNDSDSLLILVAKRGVGKEYKNGGNIYIDPNVTNIDAVLIADGSVLNYNGTAVISSSASDGGISKNYLRRQLMIYGQISSGNTTGSDNVPYGSDAYNKYGKIYKDYSYDISKLRTFEVIPVPSGLTCGDNNAPRKNDSMEGLKYAWSGKKLCKAGDSAESGLRTSVLENPVIVMYNPNIQILKPYIMQITE